MYCDIRTMTDLEDAARLTSRVSGGLWRLWVRSETPLKSNDIEWCIKTLDKAIQKLQKCLNQK